jgi:hypothetical protein
LNNLNINLNSGNNKAIKKTPTILVGVLLYLGYLAIFFAVWIVNNVDYTHIGKNAETTKLWYAIPTFLGSLFLILALSLLGWWQIIFFDKK